MGDSVSRQLAQFVHALRFEDLPPAVVDKTKALALHYLAGVLEGYPIPEVQENIRLVKQEESVSRGGSTILVDGAKVTKAGAAQVNDEMHHAIEDTYRMITHPGRSVFPGALAVAEGEASSGRDLIAAAVAGYEVQERLTGEYPPSVMARGFHPGAVFGIFGAAIAAAKLMRLSEDQLNNALGLCVSLASGNAEASKTGGRIPREGASVRNAMLAVLLARSGSKGGETSLEGDGGFYHSFAGNNKGRLSYVFTGPETTSFDTITEGLGSRWEILNTFHKIYPTGGFNGPHIDVMAKLCARDDIKPADVDRVELVVNWLEAEIPDPAFPRAASSEPKIGSTHYFSAYGIVRRGYPAGRHWIGRASSRRHDDPPKVLELMQKIHIAPSKTQTLFGPRITVYTKDGESHTIESTGREFMWDLNEEIRRIPERLPELPIPKGQFDDLMAAVSELDRLDRADRLIQLSLAQR
jgi:2-methylcitrate dehydratase PrpD